MLDMKFVREHPDAVKENIKKKGKIELEYYGLDDLNDLLDALSALKLEKRGN